MPEIARLTRVDIGGEDQKILIDKITHLGRSHKVEDHCARRTPEQLYEAKIAITVDDSLISKDGEPRISRNHFLIYSPDQEWKSFTIFDLNSKNGTWLNNRRIPFEKRVALKKDDSIQIGEVIFKYDVLSSDDRINHGLMVAHHGGNLLGVETDVKKLSEEFEKRGFNIETLINRSATKEKILERLDMFKRMATDDSIFLFYFSGHGSEDGNLQLSAYGGQFLNPKELQNALSEYRGQKLLILDGCYTDAMADHLPPRSVLISTKGRAYEGHIETMCMNVNGVDDFNSNSNVMGYLTRAIQRELMEHPHRINMDHLVEKVSKDKRIISRKQEIGYHGMTRIGLPTMLNPKIN